MTRVASTGREPRSPGNVGCLCCHPWLMESSGTRIVTVTQHFSYFKMTLETKKNNPIVLSSHVVGHGGAFPTAPLVPALLLLSDKTPDRNYVAPRELESPKTLRPYLSFFSRTISRTSRPARLHSSVMSLLKTFFLFCPTSSITRMSSVSTLTYKDGKIGVSAGKKDSQKFRLYPLTWTGSFRNI